MAESSLFYYSAEVASTGARVLTLPLVWAGAGQPQTNPPSNMMRFYPSGTHPTQDEIDEFLGTSDEFLAAQFAATPIPTNWCGGVINMEGQAKQVLGIRTMAYNAGTINDLEPGIAVSSLRTSAPSALTDFDEIQVGAYGNIGFNFGYTNFSTQGAGALILEIFWIAK